MSYLLIKKNDAKVFKAFLSGNEIEVSVLIGSQANVFDQDEDVYIFYDNGDNDSYKARVTRQRKWVTNPGDQTLLMLGIVKG